MSKRRKSLQGHTHSEKSISWLPIDSRLFPFISFSHVHGLARVFLTIEMVLSVSMVMGTCLLVIVTSIR
jgi:hypothetical protein